MTFVGESNMTYWRAYYHVVWGTKNREALITDDRIEVIRLSIAAIARENDSLIHAIGFMPDHIHLAISIPPKAAAATVIGHMKGLSSRRINKEASRPNDPFAWQPEYGLLTFGERSLPDVVAYVENQREIHEKRLMKHPFELGIEPVRSPSQPAPR
jgi:putative transposase